MNDTEITIIGNVVNKPELRFTPNGVAVANFRVASTPKQFNKTTNSMEDGETLFLTVNTFRGLAENVAASLTRGMRVIVKGNLISRSYENREGQKRTMLEIQAEAVGPDLLFNVANVQRAERKDNYGNSPESAQPPQNSNFGHPQNNSPWGGQPANSMPSEEPPF